MTDAEIIAALHAGFSIGAIPTSLPEIGRGDVQGRETTIINGGRERECTACGDTISTTEQGSIEYRYPHVTIRFHRHCAELWEAERHTPPRRA